MVYDAVHETVFDRRRVRLVDDDQEESLVAFLYDPRQELIRLISIRLELRPILDDSLLNSIFYFARLDILEKWFV